MANSRVPRAAADTGGRNGELPGEVVLVLQGGGALGAYQVGVYEALYEAGIEPDWVIGTSIGAINASLIAGNSPERRLARLNAFWDLMQASTPALCMPGWMDWGNLVSNMATVMRGIPDFFTPNLHALRGSTTLLGVEAASYYSTAPLRGTLQSLVDFEYLCQSPTR